MSAGLLFLLWYYTSNDSCELPIIVLLLCHHQDPLSCFLNKQNANPFVPLICVQAFGDDAFRLVMPTTYEIPSELRAWIDYLKQHRLDTAAGDAPSSLICGPETLWVLKTAENLGKGWCYVVTSSLVVK